MFAVDAVPIRPFGFRELLDVPFALIQANIKLLAGSALAVILAAESLVMVAAMVTSIESNGSGTAIGWTVAIGVLVAAWFVRLFLRATTTAIGMSSALGNQPTLRSTRAAVSAAAGPLVRVHLLWSLIGFGLVVLGAVVMAFVPIGVALVGFARAPGFLTTPIIFAERLGASAAMARSKVLRAGAIGRIGGLWLVMRAILVVLVLPVFGMALYVSSYSGTQRWPGIALIVTVVLLLVAFGEIVESSTAVVCYLDRLCAREAFDIRMALGVR